MLAVRQKYRHPVFVLLLVLLCTGVAESQTLYKYTGPDGELIYSDRPPVDGKVDEVRELTQDESGDTVSITTTDAGDRVRFYARNPYYAPVELQLRFKALQGLSYPAPDNDLHWVLPARNGREILSLSKLGEGAIPSARFEFEFMIGDPAARHAQGVLYRVPFALASDLLVTQAYPDVVTHTTEDSRYAIDIAAPIGTNVFAARAGIVFSVAGDNYKGGTDPERDGPLANVVQILHDDGTYAVYAHLNWNTIRVSAGDRVVRGQYIADSGNTGFSSGPHLHFAVLRNDGMQTLSLPVRFKGAGSEVVQAASGEPLRAY